MKHISVLKALLLLFCLLGSAASAFAQSPTPKKSVTKTVKKAVKRKAPQGFVATTPTASTPKMGAILFSTLPTATLKDQNFLVGDADNKTKKIPYGILKDSIITGVRQGLQDLVNNIKYVDSIGRVRDSILNANKLNKSEYVNADWNATTGKATILNKPNFDGILKQWSFAGNALEGNSNSFLGTTDDYDVVLKRRGVTAMRLLGNDYENEIGIQFGNSTAINYSSVAMGNNTKATGISSFSAGNNTEALNIGSVAMGSYTKSVGESSVAMGNNTLSVGDGSVAMGSYTQATRQTSVAMGYNTKANGVNSFAMGLNVEANGDNSFAVGEGTTASGYGETVLGTYNTPYIANPNTPSAEDKILVIGNGTGSATSNALTVLKNGNILIGKKTTGLVGTDAYVPTQKLEVVGNVFLNDVGNGLIQKSANGACWKLVVSNTGVVTAQSITCPN